MTRNGRGKASGRRENDFYPTPAWMSDHLLDRLWHLGAGMPPTILEPCAGESHIVNAILRRYPEAEMTANDIDPRHAKRDVGMWTEDATQPAFWEHLDSIGRGHEWVITNPPFSAAWDIIRHAYDHATVGIAVLLRVTWLEPPKSPAGASKAAFLAEHPPTWELIMERFSFDGVSQDSATTAWFVWFKDPAERQRIEVIPGRSPRGEKLL